MANETDFSGGRIFVYLEQDGYAVTHEPANGGVFPIAWELRKSRAIPFAEERAKRFGAKLFIAADV